MEKKFKILLLEDSGVDAELIQRLLSKELVNFECRLVMTKQSFINALEDFLPDLILSDNSLPQFNAIEALKIVRQQFEHIPFILVTGTVSEEYAATIIKLGADDYILKDRMARLPAAIEAALRNRQSEKEKHLAIQRLRDSEENYRTIMERVSDAFVAMNKEWCYTYVNKAAGEIMHRDPAILVGKCIWEEFPEGIGQPFYLAYHKAMDEQVYISMEEYYPPLGIWLENHIYPSPEGLSIFFRNITDRKKAEQAIMQSEENLKAIFDNSSEGFILLDENDRVKIFNERTTTSILANSPAELQPGKSVLDYVEPSRQEYFKEILSRVKAGEFIQYDRSFFQEDGKITWINFSFNPVWKEDLQKNQGICITGRDITEKKLAEQQREFDHNNLTALINNTRDLMWSIDTDFKLITSNQAFDNIVKQMSGITLRKGSDILEAAYNKEQIEKYKSYYERAFAGETFTEIQHSTLPFEFWSEISFYPIYEQKKVIGTACFSRDITDRRKAEKALQELERERMESKMEEHKKITRAILAAQEKERNDIGIELHDNVNQILVGTNLLLSMIKTDPEKHAHLIDNCHDQLQQAIYENRKIAHVFVTPNFETATLVNQLTKLSRTMLQASGLQVNFDITQFNEQLLDSERKFNIYRIAQEQCTNIVKYAKATAVQFSLLTNEDSFSMLISDNGIGMDPAITTRGIGLQNIRNRIGLFNGTALIHTAPGQGFSLKITIPLRNSSYFPGSRD